MRMLDSPSDWSTLPPKVVGSQSQRFLQHLSMGIWLDLLLGNKVCQGGLMVTTLNVEYLKKLIAAGLLKDTKWPPEPYMAALCESGFVDVCMEHKEDEGKPFQAIFARINKR
ncbi:uncharacterized protein zgc:194242 [Stegostoma tigrinum]|uniref:uncharacterized protein zgc:194242 n=1 Tax=Stegostoma tigrinum TaxID=3053191 RepID=UPI00202B8A48|nr:uncharacterized protein zgc:194242 [Stegostoma tigrinum]